MKTTEMTTRLRSAVDKFNIAFAILADIGGNVVDIIHEQELEEFRGLYNAYFWDASVIRSVHDFLKDSILPQMLSQGDKFCYLGLLEDRYVYGVFGKSDKSAMEQYLFSQEIHKFLR